MRKYLLSFTFALIIVVVLLLPKNKTTIYNNNAKLYSALNSVFQNIKENMDYVSMDKQTNVNPSWTHYKLDTSKESKPIYEYLVKDIRVCYIYWSDKDNVYSDSNFLAKYKNIKEVSNKEFQAIKNEYYIYNNYCINNFKKYRELLISEDKDVLELKIAVNPIVLYAEYNNFEVNNFDDILKNEYYKAKLIENITNYLKLKIENSF